MDNESLLNQMDDRQITEYILTRYQQFDTKVMELDREIGELTSKLEELRVMRASLDTDFRAYKAFLEIKGLVNGSNGDESANACCLTDEAVLDDGIDLTDLTDLDDILTDEFTDEELDELDIHCDAGDMDIITEDLPLPAEEEPVLADEEEAGTSLLLDLEDPDPVIDVAQNPFGIELPLRFDGATEAEEHPAVEASGANGSGDIPVTSNPFRVNLPLTFD